MRDLGYEGACRLQPLPVGSPLGEALNAVAAAAYAATARITVSWTALLGRFGLAADLMPARSG
jgi:hypothetical protein